MRLTVLGGCGAWPEADSACSGFLLEHHGFRLVLDLGYATMPRLLAVVAADQVDAVFISHGHPDHCADLNPLLRARALAEHPPAALPIWSPAGALDAVLALDRPGMLDDAYAVHEVADGSRFDIGPFAARTRLLPHWLPNLGIRLTAGDATIAYTGDAGPSPELPLLAKDADLLIAEASYVAEVPADSAEFLSSARQIGRQAAEAGVRRLLLTHLWPGTDRQMALAAAAEGYGDEIGFAATGLVVELP